uniref:Protein PHYTOCHROME KINASE SUBSTRATE 3 n=1 Tax=Davidia involucrata TaxID=16924 RepID=A0A5B6YH24_DAVIN
MDSEDNINHLRVASFSAYLNTAEENFVLKIDKMIQESPPAIFSAEETPCPITIGRIKTKESEISVFGADRYFNMKINYENPGLADNTTRKHGHKKEDLADQHRLKPNFRHGTPSTTSEASWNSQTALLPSLLRNSSQNKQKRAIGKRFLLGFGCGGPCLDKKSVYIDGSAAHGVVQGKGTKHSEPGLTKGEHFDFPILNSGMENLAVKKQLEVEKLEEEQRKSLEVFGSHMMKKGDNIAVNLERKLSMLTWDAIPKSQNLSTTLGSSGICDDIESDASSDLFEIENISGTGQYSMLTRQTSDNMSSCMTPTTQYAPSEASIEWSVVTASAADFSVASDYERNIVNAEHMISSSISKLDKTKNIGGKAQKGGPSGLLGCNSNKAVSVAETAYRANEKAIGKSQRIDFEFSRVQHSFATRVISP